LGEPNQEIESLQIQATAQISEKYQEVDWNDRINFGTPPATVNTLNN
jgi:hypothetical protein